MCVKAALESKADFQLNFSCKFFHFFQEAWRVEVFCSNVDVYSIGTYLWTNQQHAFYTQGIE